MTIKQAIRIWKLRNEIQEAAENDDAALVEELQEELTRVEQDDEY